MPKDNILVHSASGVLYCIRASRCQFSIVTATLPSYSFLSFFQKSAQNVIEVAILMLHVLGMLQGYLVDQYIIKVIV